MNDFAELWGRSGGQQEVLGRGGSPEALPSPPAQLHPAGPSPQPYAATCASAGWGDT
jgi:hypothetical protein